MQMVLWLMILEAVYKDSCLCLSDGAWVGYRASQVPILVCSYVFGKNMSSTNQSLTDNLPLLVSYFLRLHRGDRF
jgi:hypothetical protein